MQNRTVLLMLRGKEKLPLGFAYAQVKPPGGPIASTGICEVLVYACTRRKDSLHQKPASKIDQPLLITARREARGGDG